MARTRKKPRGSLFKRFLYFVIVVTGGSSGWLVKDYPAVKAVWSLVSGEPVPGDGQSPDTAEAITATVAKLLKPADQFSQPGTYQVTIPKVHLDPHLFKVGHTVDIQARVLKVDPQGRSTTLWETKAVRRAAGRRRQGRADRGMAPPAVPGGVEPRRAAHGRGLRPPDRPLRRAQAVRPRARRFRAPRVPAQARHASRSRPAQKPDSPVDPRNNNIVLQSQRVGNLQGQARSGRHPAAIVSVGPVSRAASAPRATTVPSSSSEPIRAEGANGVSVRTSLSLDRFEGKGKSIAVLLTDDGETLNIPRSLLPPSAKPGDVLTLTLEHDPEATRKLADETRQVQDKLSQGDPGGDIQL